MRDEALSGYVVNKQNVRFGGTENPRVTQDERLQPLKATIWCADFAGGVIEASIFEDVAGQTVPVNGEHYKAMTNDFFLPQLDELGLEYTGIQQDGATLHTTRATIDMPEDAFPGRLMSRCGKLQ